MQVTASNKYENVYPHPVPAQPSRIPQFVWIKPRPSVPRQVGVLGVLGIRGGWGGSPPTRAFDVGQPQTLLRFGTQEVPIK